MCGILLIIAIAGTSVVTASGVNGSRVARQDVDLLELNHFLDESGRHVYDQVVFYEWVPDRSLYRVVAWRMVKRQSQLPVRSWDREGWRCIWQDDRIMRDVFAPMFRETWTQQDPERVNRKLFAESERTELYVPPALRTTANSGSSNTPSSR